MAQSAGVGIMQLIHTFQGPPIALALNAVHGSQPLRCAYRLAAKQATTSAPEAAQQDGDMHSSSSFNESNVEQSQGSRDQTAPSEKAVEELLEVADERVSQAEQRALKAEEATQAQEGLIQQLCDENLKLGEEIQRLNSRSVLMTCCHLQQGFLLGFGVSALCKALDAPIGNDAVVLCSGCTTLLSCMLHLACGQLERTTVFSSGFLIRSLSQQELLNCSPVACLSCAG